MIDNNVSETPAEHKSHNCIELENGQFGLYPNNRMRLYDLSITPEDPLMPDFKVSTIEYQVENESGWGRLGDSDEYFWETLKEKNDGQSPVDKSQEFMDEGMTLITETDSDKIKPWQREREISTA